MKILLTIAMILMTVLTVVSTAKAQELNVSHYRGKPYVMKRKWIKQGKKKPIRHSIRR